MSGSATRVDIRKGGMPGEVFPTADHPPENILMGGEQVMVISKTNQVSTRRIAYLWE